MTTSTAAGVAAIIEQWRRSPLFADLDTWLSVETSDSGDAVLVLCCVHGSRPVAIEKDGQFVAVGEAPPVEQQNRAEVEASAVERAAGMLVPDISVATKMRRERYTLQDAADRLRDHAAGLREGVVRMGQVTPNSTQPWSPPQAVDFPCPFGNYPRMPRVVVDVEYDLWVEDLNSGRMHYGDLSSSIEELLENGGVQLSPVLNVAPAGAEYVRDGVCLLCGDGVLKSGEHLDLDRHRRAVADLTGGYDETTGGRDA